MFVIIPSIRKLHEDWFNGGREGIEVSANTGFVYLKGNEDRASWLEITLLGFGLGFTWGYDNKDFI